MVQLHYVLLKFNMEIPSCSGEPDETIRSPELHDQVLRSCHVSLVYLGDLSRYRELQAVHKSGKQDWGPALGYYQLARRLLPNSGSPMNQLAVVAIYTDNVLASTYYFLRAICAVEAFSTARENLGLGFKKIISKDRLRSTGPLDLFIKLHAGLYLNDKLATSAKDQKQLLSSLGNQIKDRLISVELLCQLVCTNIGAAYLHSNIELKKGSMPTQNRNTELYHDLNIKFCLLLLDIFSGELAQIGMKAEDLSLQISAVLRQILPALRISSKWFKINLTGSRQMWNNYLRAMTLCGSKFPRIQLPQLTYPLQEDLDMRGFAPLEGGLSGSPLSEQDTGVHPNEEMLSRISALLDDAAFIAQQIVREFVHIVSSLIYDRTWDLIIEPLRTPQALIPNKMADHYRRQG